MPEPAEASPAWPSPPARGVGAVPLRWRSRALTLLLFVLASSAVVLPNALGDPRVSVFDEMTHADWVASLRSGDAVRRGDTIDPEVLVEWACRGWVYNEGLPACADAPGDVTTYPARGLNYNSFHPPGYYLPTAVGSLVVEVVAPGTDLVTASRVVGVGWSVLAMVGVYAVARELGARVSVARAAGLVVAGFVAATGGWLGLQSLRAGDATYVDPVPGDVAGSDALWAVVAVGIDTLPPTAGARSPMDLPERALEGVTTWARAGDLVVGAVPLVLVFVGLGAASSRRRARSTAAEGGVLVDDPRWVGAPLGGSVLVGLLVGAMALNAQHWLAKGTAMSTLHPRYGLVLLPALLGGLAMLADRHRPTRVALWVFAVVGVVVGVATGVLSGG